ncbi:12402_t:CDS:2 [Funneliformis mosseae]|uniref:12402_t:CDS:1 n=2 Tax=Funneliformis TaxID=1117308 RepID=A0A9N8YV92_FUNMO|nr:12402_t:CDS:2 [Funneliformis mosseae]
MYQPGAPLHSEYHGAGRGEYPPPPPEGYYPHPPPMLPHMAPPPPPPGHMHHPYYDYHHSHHYMSYHPASMNPNIAPPVPPPAPPIDFGDKRSKSNANAPTSEGIDKNKISTFITKSTVPILHKARFKKERFGAFDPPTAGEEEDKRTYTLIVSQQPLRARMCGFGEKDRRPIDPPPIVQLVVTDEKGIPDTGMLQNPFFVLHVTLWSEDGREERNVISNPPKTTRVLMGSLVSSPAILKNTTGEQGCYFCFPDLSIRTEGKYTLKFSLMKLGTEDRLINTRTEIIATTYSDPFTVYSAKKFPGMTESTELSKAFAKQGLKIPIRNDVRPRKITED